MSLAPKRLSKLGPMLVIGHLAAKTRWKKWFASSIWMEETRAHMFEHGAWEHMGARDVHKEQLCPSMKCMLHNQSLYVNVIFICINSAVRMQVLCRVLNIMAGQLDYEHFRVQTNAAEPFSLKGL